MKKILLLAVLVLASNFSYASWELAAQGAKNKNYYETKSIQKMQSGSVTVLGIVDYIAPEKIGNLTYLSLATKTEFDCVQPRMRFLEMAIYPKNMGQGKALWKSDSPDEWKDLPSFDVQVREALCGLSKQ